VVAVGARVFRNLPEATEHSTPWHYHEWGFQIGYITKGWALFEFEGVGQVRIEAGTFLLQLPNNRHRDFGSSPDFEAIEITFPANTKTTVLKPSQDGYEEVSVEIK
jgi:quercetin dioxygenase-like cupin family protein